MSFLTQPWFLISFAVAAFLVFGAVGAKGNEVNVPKKTSWMIAGISVIIVTFCAFKVLHDNGWLTF